MDARELDDKLDSLSIARQLTALHKHLVDARGKLALANRLWERAVAAEEWLTAEEAMLFDAAVEAFVQVRFEAGCHKPRRRRQK